MSTAKTVSKNALVLLVGSVATHGLGLVYIGILARYLGVEGMGKISAAIALVAMLFVLVNYGFNTLVVRDVAHDRSRAPVYVSNVLFLRLVFVGVVALVLTVIVQLSPYPEDTKLIVALYAVVHALDAFSDVMRCIFDAFQRMGYRAATEFGRQALNVALSLLGIALGWSLVQLVLVSILASFARLVVTALILRARFVRPVWGIDWSLCRRLLTASFPFFMMFLINVLIARSGVVGLSWLDTEQAVGLYAAALLPIVTILFVPDMIMDSLFPVMAEAGRSPSRLAQVYRTVFKVMLMVGLPMGAGCALVADHAIAAIYGPQFAAAAPVLKLLSLYLLLTIIGYVNGCLMMATGRQSVFTAWRLASAALGLLLIFLLVPRYSYWGAAIGFVAVSALDFVVFTALCLGYTKERFPWLFAAKVGVAAGVMALAGHAALAVGAPVLVVVPFAALVYVVLLFVSRSIGQWEREFLSTIPLLRQLLPVGWRATGGSGVPVSREELAS